MVVLMVCLTVVTKAASREYNSVAQKADQMELARAVPTVVLKVVWKVWLLADMMAADLVG